MIPKKSMSTMFSSDQTIRHRANMKGARKILGCEMRTEFKKKKKDII